MGFRINTNVAAMNAHTLSLMNNRGLDTSLERLSSGLRINKAADDAAGMMIADSLKSQSSSLGQSIKNANDGVGIIQIADKAMEQQLKILDTIKTKATQAAQDGQTASSRAAIQSDITKLMASLDSIATTTSYNGQKLLSGGYSGKAFQVGGYSSETVGFSIGATNSDKIGHVRVETAAITAEAAALALSISSADGTNLMTIESVTISNTAGTGVGVLANAINKNSDKLGVKASWTAQSTGNSVIAGGDIISLSINGVKIGNVSAIAANDADGKLAAAINAITDQTGVEAFTDDTGRLNLRSIDGRGIVTTSDSENASGLSLSTTSNYGRLTLLKLGANDIVFSAGGYMESTSAAVTLNLGDVAGTFSGSVASAIGANANSNIGNTNTNGIGAGVTSLKGAMVVMEIADSAIKQLGKVRASLGSVQNQMVSTINNISITQVNVKAAESQIRDVDFAEESATFQKHNILAQSGSYAMSQANQAQQNVMRLLQ